MKLNHQIVTAEYLRTRIPFYHKKGYPTPKWIDFSLQMIEKGWTVRVYEARRTVSKYIFVSRGSEAYKIRFSNHKAEWQKENAGDSDFYVGVGNNGIVTTEQLISKLNTTKENENRKEIAISDSK